MGKVDRAFIDAFRKRRAKPVAQPPVPPSAPAPAPPASATGPPPSCNRLVAAPTAAPRPQAPPPARIRKVGSFQISQTVRMLEQVAFEQLETLGRILRQGQEQAGLKSLMFTSCYRGEGRSTLLVALSRMLPRVVRARTVLVDADFMNPGVSRELGVEATVGLDDIVREKRSLDEALVVSHNDAFAVLPLRNEVHDPQQFINSPRLGQTLAQLRQTFDLVLVDASPVFSTVDPTILHDQIDGAILVVNREVTEDASALRARHMLEAAGLTVLGMAETFA